ncbi:guanine-1-methyltransferase-domain-containing protein [Pseudomassariella vexata]|uniref:tRNA (guanine(9)-N1)-methyltransferase n=1 Tax=Pseudomassariella vexata TaxID=1141098 RepID=A0A1Y2DJ15_9PEZI|nr:guanine-1-methyltransferase-domain-containing protein [Pseudomassariella vexata]ORY58805.1 guanine-1-methyltransferase-domain-containing protein [Pseudomassariella vexata]
MDSSTDGLASVVAEHSESDWRQTNDREDPAIRALATNGSNDCKKGAAADENVEITTETPHGTKRPAVDPAEGVQEPPLSKNQQRKLKRQKLWEEKRGERAEKRKEKRHNKQEQKRQEKEAGIRSTEEGEKRTRDPKKQTKVPVAIIIDCQYESYMTEKEMISLSSQVTRCYSDNRSAQFPVHLYISSYGGAMKSRHETVLHGQVNKWKGIHFVQPDFVETARQVQGVMSGQNGGKITEVLQAGEDRTNAVSLAKPDPSNKKYKKGLLPMPELEPDDVDKSIVYLTADSPYILEHLEPNVSYVVGGIIDRNREKGLCYKVARERNVRTAKLPIGEYMVLQDRHVLATNHVVEIMLRWLELGDWGEAFMKVIPQRKGGKLKHEGSVASEAGEGDAKYQEGEGSDATGQEAGDPTSGDAAMKETPDEAAVGDAEVKNAAEAVAGQVDSSTEPVAYVPSSE